MKLLDRYFALQAEIFAYFGYVENWRAFPLDDKREMFWRLNGSGNGGSVQFAKSEDELLSESGDYYENEIYTQRHLSRWVYRGERYTMIVVDTRVDGNKFLQVFNNTKERAFQE